MASDELVTGQRLWEINAAGISTPWVAGEWLFVVTDDAQLLCIARATGKIRWISQLKHYANAKKKKNPMNWTGPVLAGGRLMLVSMEGEGRKRGVKGKSVSVRVAMGGRRTIKKKSIDTTQSITIHTP